MEYALDWCWQTLSLAYMGENTHFLKIEGDSMPLACIFSWVGIDSCPYLAGTCPYWIWVYFNWSYNRKVDKCFMFRNLSYFTFADKCFSTFTIHLRDYKYLAYYWEQLWYLYWWVIVLSIWRLMLIILLDKKFVLLYFNWDRKTSGRGSCFRPCWAQTDAKCVAKSGPGKNSSEIYCYFIYCGSHDEDKDLCKL